MNRTITLYISQDQYKWLDEIANQASRSKSYIVQQLIDRVRLEADNG